MPERLNIAQLGHPILKNKANAVSNISDQHIQALIKNMIFTVKESHGVGIAAPQVFEPYQIMIISSKPNERYPLAPYMPITTIINPIILDRSLEKQEGWEGCLSIPGIRAQISREDWVKVQYMDELGREHKKHLKTFIARIFLHEYDHLIGKNLFDHVEQSQKIMSESEWARQYIQP